MGWVPSPQIAQPGDQGIKGSREIQTRSASIGKVQEVDKICQTIAMAQPVLDTQQSELVQALFSKKEHQATFAFAHKQISQETVSAVYCNLHLQFELARTSPPQKIRQNTADYRSPTEGPSRGSRIYSILFLLMGCNSDPNWAPATGAVVAVTWLCICIEQKSQSFRYIPTWAPLKATLLALFATRGWHIYCGSKKSNEAHRDYHRVGNSRVQCSVMHCWARAGALQHEYLAHGTHWATDDRQTVHGERALNAVHLADFSACRRTQQGWMLQDVRRDG
jgi:hypothetical protein